jgi:hypothetical protein
VIFAALNGPQGTSYPFIPLSHVRLLGQLSLLGYIFLE